MAVSAAAVIAAIVTVLGGWDPAALSPELRDTHPQQDVSAAAAGLRAHATPENAANLRENPHRDELVELVRRISEEKGAEISKSAGSLLDTPEIDQAIKKGLRCLADEPDR